MGASILLALFCFSQAGYIQIKAVLAQILLEQAWARAERLGQPQKPWPWADVVPFAVLSVPSLGVKQFVLSSHSGEALAFGPGMHSNDEVDVAPIRVLAGHRDTHFKFLQHVMPNTRVTLQMLGAPPLHFRVKSQRIMDARVDALSMTAWTETLFMVTCYPFNAVNQGPLRYVITAISEQNDEKHNSP